MRVRCERLQVGDGEGPDRTASGWLTVGREYDVLEVTASPGWTVKFRLIADDPARTPALFPAEMFSVTSDAVPLNWSVVIREGGLTLRPRAWQAPGFWEDYFDGVGWAVDSFNSERDAILGDDAGAERA